MKYSKSYLIKVLSIGAITFILFPLLIFAVRKTCDSALLVLSLHEGLNHRPIMIEPSKLAPDLNDRPDIVIPSHTKLLITDNFPANSFKMILEVDNINNQRYGYLDPMVHLAQPLLHPRNVSSLKNSIYFDQKSGLFVHCDLLRKDKKWTKTIHAYAGPEGVAATPEKNLGRFKTLPLACGLHGRPSIVFYNRSKHCFGRIDFKEKKLTRGPKLDKSLHPVQISRLEKNSNSVYLNWRSPLVVKKDASKEIFPRYYRYRRRMYANLEPILTHNEASHRPDWQGDFIPVLDKHLSIYCIDPETLRFNGNLGSIPGPASQFNKNKKQFTTDDLFAYRAEAFIRDGKYQGLITAGLSLDSYDAQLAEFDKKGNRLNQTISRMEEKAAMGPGGFLFMSLRYLIENLHPPALHGAAFLAESNCDTLAAQQALFLLPDSFIVHAGREFHRDPYIIKLLFALLTELLQN